MTFQKNEYVIGTRIIWLFNLQIALGHDVSGTVLIAVSVSTKAWK